MAGKKPRTLRTLRLALSVLAVILFCLTVVSGILSFSGGRSAPSPTEPSEQTAPSPPPSDDAGTEPEAPEPDLPLNEDGDSEAGGAKGTEPGTTAPNPTAPKPTRPPAPPAEAPAEETTEAPAEAPTEAYTEAPAKALTETPAEAADAGTAEAPTEAATEAAAEAAAEGAAEASTEAADEGAAEASIAAADAGADDASAEESAALPAKGSAATPAEGTDKTPDGGTGDAAETEAGENFSGRTPFEPSFTEDTEGAPSASEPAMESTETTVPMDAEEPPPRETASDVSPLWKLLFRISLCLLIADLAGISIVSLRIREMENENPPDPAPVPQPVPGRLTVGTVHCQGRRQYQQDSLGHSIVLDGCGVLAVVADGMGGLKDGDKVSQQVVLRTLELGDALRPGQENGALSRILKTVNEDVNRTLTPDGLYKSGSTVVAVLVSGEYFQWISVGDSRIYLYREGFVNQLNRDHDLLQDWMPEILDGRRSMEASRKDPAGRKLTSFIGMGQLKYVDRSLHAIKIIPGDRILLMSDGVYGQLPEEQMAALLRRFPDVRQAAAEIDRHVRAAQNPHQDNYTALILGF